MATVSLGEIFHKKKQEVIIKNYIFSCNMAIVK